MSTIDRHPLGNFEQLLLTELTAHLKPQSAPGPLAPAPTRRRVGSLRPGTGALTTVVALAAAVVVVVFSARSGVQPALARAFPIVTQRPQPLPGYMQQILETQKLPGRGDRLARDRAYAFQTPAGTGYVVVDQRNKWLCILIPDLDTSRASVRCESSNRLLSRASSGLQVRTGDHAEHELVWLLPDGSRATTITAAGALRHVVLRNGVLVIATQDPVTITTSVHGRQATIVYPSS